MFLTHIRLFADVVLWAVLPASCPPRQLVLAFKTNQDTPPLRSSFSVSTPSLSGSAALLCTHLMAQVLCASLQNDRGGSSELRQCFWSWGLKLQGLCQLTDVLQQVSEGVCGCASVWGWS